MTPSICFLFILSMSAENYSTRNNRQKDFYNNKDMKNKGLAHAKQIGGM